MKDSDSVVGNPGHVLLCLLEPLQGHISGFIVLFIAEYRLSQHFHAAGHIQDIVLNLKCKADGCGHLFHQPGLLLVCTGEKRADHHRGLQKRSRLQMIDEVQLFMRNRLIGQLHIHSLPTYHAIDSGFLCQNSDTAAHDRSLLRQGKRLCRRLHRVDEQTVSGKNRHVIPILYPRGWKPSAELIVIHTGKVVVN